MRHLPVNLASVPFERARRLRRVLVVATAVIGLLSLVHVGVAAQLLVGGPSPEDAALEAADRSFAEKVADWRAESEALAAAADPTHTRELAEAVELANGLIAWRVLPWEPLFEALEAALPEDVRLELVRPTSDVDAVRVELVAAGRSRPALGALLAALEEQPVLSEVFPAREERGDDGRHRMTIRAIYRDRGTAERAVYRDPGTAGGRQPGLPEGGPR